MTKTYMSKEKIMQHCSYSEAEFIEYYGEECIGTICYGYPDETIYEVCVTFDGTSIKYRFDEIGTWFHVYDSLEDFEADWL